jgi:hypothetical protein
MKALEAENKSTNVEAVRSEFESAWGNANVPLEIGDF